MIKWFNTPVFIRSHFILLVTASLGIILYHFFNIPIDQLISYFLGVSWVSMILHPGTKEYVERPSYRFSLVKLVYLMDQKIISIVGNLKQRNIIRQTARILPPLVFVLLLYAISKQGSVLWCAIGAAGSLLLHQLFLKHTLG